MARAGLLLDLRAALEESRRTGTSSRREGVRVQADGLAAKVATFLAANDSCIDSRTPAELVFDLGVGDVFSVRIAGNVTSRKVLGSIEYGCAVAGAKLFWSWGIRGAGP